MARKLLKPKSRKTRMAEDNRATNRPVCELRHVEHLDSLPPFPVVDMHAHFGPLLLGENYERAFDDNATRIFNLGA